MYLKECNDLIHTIVEKYMSKYPLTVVHFLEVLFVLEFISIPSFI